MTTRSRLTRTAVRCAATLVAAAGLYVWVAAATGVDVTYESLRSWYPDPLMQAAAS